MSALDMPPVAKCTAQEAGKCRLYNELLAKVERLKKDRDQGGRDYTALMERHDAEFVRAEAAEAARDAALGERDEALRMVRALVPWRKRGGPRPLFNEARDFLSRYAAQSPEGEG